MTADTRRGRPSAARSARRHARTTGSARPADSPTRGAGEAVESEASARERSGPGSRGGQRPRSRRRSSTAA
jgi:hypothetical protein